MTTTSGAVVSPPAADQATRAARRRVPLNGPALRHIRELSGLSIDDVADALHCDRSYVSMLELGHRDACSPLRFARLVECLRLPDRRAIMAYPYSEPADPPTAPVPVQKNRRRPPGRHRVEQAAEASS